MAFGLQVLITLVQIALGFYGFWLIWRVLLPVLPGPKDASDRVAPYACYFTDPFIQPLARLMRLSSHHVALFALVLVAIGQVLLQRLGKVL